MPLARLLHERSMSLRTPSRARWLSAALWLAACAPAPATPRGSSSEPDSAGSAGKGGNGGNAAGGPSAAGTGGNGSSGGAVTSGAAGAAVAGTAGSEPEAPRPLEDVQREYIELRFGMFIHFGILTYTGSWSQANLPIEQFNPLQLDPGQWADAAVAAHMKYGVLTTRHHDGFGLWNSAVSDFDVGSIS